MFIVLIISKCQMLKNECYQFLKNELGKVDIVGFGSYGQVKLARNTQNDQVVAIKMIYNKNAKQQIDVHHKLNHPNIIKLINYYYQKDKNITYMVLEYASGGSLNQKIKFGYGQLSKALIKRYFKDICEAVNYLHQNNYMHRDIKTQNILITEDNHAKLCDFGFASILQYRSTLCGTFQYMAPQMIQKKPYDYKIDIWALGILLFELIQGYAPFRGDTGEEVIKEMKKSLTFSARFDQIEIDLIKKILRVNAENRPQISKILQHPYFETDEKDLTLKEGDSQKKLKEDKHQKSIKELKEDAPNRYVKHENPEVKRKEGKFDFFHRKAGETKKEEPNIEKVEKTQKPEKPEKKREHKQSYKEFPKQQHKNVEFRRDFKPYVPSNLQSHNRNLIKSPTFKTPATSYTPVHPQGFPQAHHSFNTSLQTSPNYQGHSSFPTAPNPNASMTTTTAKYFQPSSPTHNLGLHSGPMNNLSSPILGKGMHGQPGVMFADQRKSGLSGIGFTGQVGTSQGPWKKQ